MELEISVVEMAVLHGDLYRENIVYHYYLLIFYHYCKEGLYSCIFN